MHRKNQRSVELFMFFTALFLTAASVLALPHIPKIGAVNILLLHVMCYLVAFLLSFPLLLLYAILNVGALFLFKIYEMGLWEQNIPFAIEIMVGTLVIFFLHDSLQFGTMTSAIMGLLFGRLAYFIAGFIVEDWWLSILPFRQFILERVYQQVPGILLIVIFVPLVIYGIEKHTIIMPHE